MPLYKSTHQCVKIEAVASTNMADEAFSERNVQVALVIAVILGILLGLSLSDQILSDYELGLPDVDGDGVPDSSDLNSDGDAGLRFTLVDVVHDINEQPRNITLILGYNDNGDSSGSLVGQVCVLNMTIEANTSVSRPLHHCVFQVDDYAARAVSFEYRMYEEEQVNHEVLLYKWDIFAGDDDVNPWGTNLTVDPAFLGAGSTVHLDGMSDSDSWERNARIVWHVSSVQIYAE